MGTVVRTCVGCRRREDRDLLVRLGAREGRLTPVAGGGPGRSAYVCADVACFDKAARRGGFARALRARVTIDERTRAAVADACGTVRGGEGRGQEEGQ
jgi:predicted RNA-binding protein YlxR (DUF448 family)